MWRGLRARVARLVGSWSPEERDAVLYSASALFAIVTAQTSSDALYQQWGRLATGPYVIGAVISAWRARRARRATALAAESWQTGRTAPEVSTGAPGMVAPAALAQGVDTQWHWTTPRMATFLLVLVGATLLPLSLEVLWRADNGGHVQPEVKVVETAGKRVLHGQDQYQLVDGGRHHVAVPSGQPAYDVYNPYLPLMSVFGIAHATKAPARLTDARVAFSLLTIIVVVAALALCRGPTGPRVLTLQVMTVLPTAALPLATGGDDLPVVALMLFGLVLMQRRRPMLAGVVLGVAASMKITAWPLVLLAVFGALDRRGRPGRRPAVALAAGLVAVMVPAIVPTMLDNVPAFVDNVVRFPLGLAGISSPAASPLLGHVLVSAFPHVHRLFTVSVAGAGAVVLAYVLIRHRPRTPAGVSWLVALAMAVAILMAPATRIGYFLYPIDLAVWAWLLRGEEADAEVLALAPHEEAHARGDEDRLRVG
ncbi:MAG: glycosyltransferase family 87 protein [Acidimicrobiales bacterium]